MGSSLAFGWPPPGDAFISAFLGALVCLLLQGAFRLIRRRRGSPKSGPGAPLLREIEAAEQGLREFAREVETRLDAKLDRLELLVKVAGKGAGTAAESLAARGTGSAQTVEEAGDADSEALLASFHRQDDLRTISPQDQERVLALAGQGKPPDVIAEAAGLLRGEVDLILRLHRSAERVRE